MLMSISLNIKFIYNLILFLRDQANSQKMSIKDPSIYLRYGTISGLVLTNVLEKIYMHIYIYIHIFMYISIYIYVYLYISNSESEIIS